MKNLSVLFPAALVAAMLGFLSCNQQSDNGLAPYAGDRALGITRVTQNFTPDLQWLGGRVAAVGVNKGSSAALDSTLVWLMTAPDNSISSYITIGAHTDSAKIRQVGGMPADSLSDNTQYTFWIATRALFDANLVDTQRTRTNFFDTTLTTRLYLKGIRWGIVRINILHQESVLDDKFVISWTPDTIAFRRIALRQGSSGGFTDLLWHVVEPDSVRDNILPSVVLGVPPPGTQTAIALTQSLVDTTYFLWMANSQWQVNNFRPNAPGYAGFTIVQGNGFPKP